jgi:hypothetical protein
MAPDGGRPPGPIDGLDPQWLSRSGAAGESEARNWIAIDGDANRSRDILLVIVRIVHEHQVPEGDLVQAHSFGKGIGVRIPKLRALLRGGGGGRLLGVHQLAALDGRGSGVRGGEVAAAAVGGRGPESRGGRGIAVGYPWDPKHYGGVQWRATGGHSPGDRPVGPVPARGPGSPASVNYGKPLGDIHGHLDRARAAPVAGGEAGSAR